MNKQLFWIIVAGLVAALAFFMYKKSQATDMPQVDEVVEVVEAIDIPNDLQNEDALDGQVVSEDETFDFEDFDADLEELSDEDWAAMDAELESLFAELDQ